MGPWLVYCLSLSLEDNLKYYRAGLIVNSWQRRFCVHLVSWQHPNQRGVQAAVTHNVFWGVVGESQLFFFSVKDVTIIYTKQSI